MVVSMVALPLVAVLGLKVPAFVHSTVSWHREMPAVDKPALRSNESKDLASNDHAASSSQGRGDPAANAETPKADRHDQASHEERHNDANDPFFAKHTDDQVSPASNTDVRSPVDSAVQPAGGVEAASRADLGYDDAQPLPQYNPPPADPFTQIQSRLRGLGATHYALETIGSQGDSYRFQCRMAAGHDAHYSRHFEATDVEPLRAMRTVLDEVEAWKSGRAP